MSHGNVLSETKLIYRRRLNKTLAEERCTQIELGQNDSFVSTERNELSDRRV